MLTFSMVHVSVDFVESLLDPHMEIQYLKK